MCRAKVVLAVMVASLFTGCGTPRAITYYELKIPATPSPSTYTYPIEVIVGRIDGSELMEAAPIVYRTSQNQTGTYQYHRWSEAPVQMIQTKLIRLLRASGEYQSVSGLGNLPRGDLVVRGRLYDFIEVDGDTISGLVSMELELFNRKTATILWTHFYTGTEPVQGRQVGAVTLALDRNLDRGLNEMTSGLSRYFASNPPGKIQAAGAADARAK